MCEKWSALSENRHLFGLSFLSQKIQSMLFVTPVNKYLISKHMEAYKELERLKATYLLYKQVKVIPKPKQLTLEGSKDRAKVWDINNPRAHLVQQQIAEMMALEC